MTAPSAIPAFAPTFPATLFAPTGEDLKLSTVEQRVMNYLSAQLLDPQYQAGMELSRLYGEGMNVVESLGIAIPPELETLRTVMGWCGAGLGARSERLTLRGFRMPGKTTVDDNLQQGWQANNLDAESVLVHDDAMMYGRSFVVLGVHEDRDRAPLSTVESPRSMIASWDARKRRVSAAYQTYLDVDPASDTFLQQLATLYTSDAIIQMVSSTNGWLIQKRNLHTLGEVPVIMFPNRPTPSNRYGVSEIAPSWRNAQDRAARGSNRNEAAAEFFASLKVWLLGVDKKSFEKADGSFATALETFTGRVSLLESDKNGVLPQIVFQQGQDPSGLIKFIEHQAHIFAGNAGIPVDYLGLAPDGNPTSADAQTKGDYRLTKCAERLGGLFGNCWEDWARMMLRIWGKSTDGAELLESEWGKFGIPTPNADTVRVTTQVANGMVPPDSDDALTEVGWTPVQRQRIAADRKRTQGLAVLDQAIEGLKPQQPMDGEQPAALMALQQQRDGIPTA